jgi:hypothetical protein
LSVVRYCLFIIFAATLHIGGRSSIRNLRTRLAVVTGTRLSWPMDRSFYQVLCSDFGSGSFIDSKLLNFIYLRYSLGGAAIWRSAQNFSRHRICAHCPALLASSAPVRICVLTYITTEYKTPNLYLGQGFSAFLDRVPH